MEARGRRLVEGVFSAKTYVRLGTGRLPNISGSTGSNVMNHWKLTNHFARLVFRRTNVTGVVNGIQRLDVASRRAPERGGYASELDLNTAIVPCEVHPKDGKAHGKEIVIDRETAARTGK